MSKENIQQQRTRERAQDLKWGYLFRGEDEPNPCVLCGKPFKAAGLVLGWGNHYACDECLEKLRPDLWRQVLDFRTHYRKPNLTASELTGRDNKVQQLIGYSLTELWRKHVEWEKATVSRRRT